MNPEILINGLRKSRQNLLSVLESVPKAKWEVIPEGFNNNLFWNVAHTVVTQQLLVYRLSGLATKINDSLIDRYRKGTTPPSDVTEEEKALVKELVMTTVDDLEKDWKEGVFDSTDFKEYPTSFGITLNSSEEALSFNNIHEGLHLGYAMALKRMLLK